MAKSDSIVLIYPLAEDKNRIRMHCMIRCCEDELSPPNIIFARNENDYAAIAKLVKDAHSRNSPLSVVLDRQIRNKYNHALNLFTLGILLHSNAIKLYWYDTKIYKPGFFRDTYYDGLEENSEDLLELAVMYFDYLIGKMHRRFIYGA